MHRSFTVVLAFLATWQAYAGPDSPVRVLFVGNSYTYVNNLPAVFDALAAASGTTVSSEMMAAPGATLRDHWHDEAVQTAISSGYWDYVILQEQSTLGTRLINGEVAVQDPVYFHHYARRFVEFVRAAGSEPVLLLTWAWKNHPEHLQPITYAYMEIGRQLDVPVIPAGLAWQKVVKSGGPNLYLDDGVHPSAAGTYLTGLVLYATFFGHLPATGVTHIEGNPTDMAGTVYEDSSAVLVNLTHGAAGALRSTAAEVVRLFRETDGYVEVPRPPVPVWPQLPEGGPAEATEIIGVWRGPIRLLRTPAELRLTIVEEDDGYAATWELLFENERFNQKAHIDDFRTLENQVRFTVGGLQVLPGVSEYRGVMQGDRLVGVAEHLDEGGQTRLVGTWELVRVQPDE